MTMENVPHQEKPAGEWIEKDRFWKICFPSADEATNFARSFWQEVDSREADSVTRSLERYDGGPKELTYGINRLVIRESRDGHEVNVYANSNASPLSDKAVAFLNAYH